MTKVFTIKEGVPFNIYGFERSQLARQDIFKQIGVDQQLVLPNVSIFVPNFVETLEDLGFENFYHVIFEKSVQLAHYSLNKKRTIELKY